MKVDKYSKDGKVIGEVELSDAVFSVEINDTLIYELIKSANANLRQGTHKTKGRSEISGGGAKPWRQKGTGRARQGTTRSPIWRGGGTVFGPLPRDYRIELPKKMKQAAYRSLLSLKVKNGEVKVVEDFTAGGKTKEIAQLGKALNVSKGVLVSDSDDTLIKRAFNNICWFAYNNVERLSSRDIFYSKQVVITESAVKRLNAKYAKGE
ncbi:MAG TPA: 50S ribosomal protein L4 [Spirochaetota bacterium]|nr:50S ribosomal protein L4 [Spirochaetota bacterium]HPI88033.1 50S ribosomal protein L4 [Spirochaetota bacterium]HPR46482.1 50S ribosomal protein L4 [Spirochaetota bacterium]